MFTLSFFYISLHESPPFFGRTFEFPSPKQAFSDWLNLDQWFWKSVKSFQTDDK